jgi:hypothetical protein
MVVTRDPGKVDLAIWVISSANGPNTELAGVLPAQPGKSNSYVAGILSISPHNHEAKALLSCRQYLARARKSSAHVNGGFDQVRGGNLCAQFFR